MITYALLGAFAAFWLFIAWTKIARPLLPRYREWRDIRLAAKHLDVRHGWIVERGRHPGIAVLHCGTCQNFVRVFNMGRNVDAMEMLIDHLAQKKCDHRQKESA